MFMKKIAIIILILIVLASCNNNKNTLEIYLVSSNLPESEADFDIDKLILEETPILTLDDIQRYYWDDRAFILKKDLLNNRLTERFNIEPGKMLVPTYGKPFVVIVNSERIYMGKFWSHLSSQLEFFIPLIYVESFTGEDSPDILKYDLQPDEQLYTISWIEMVGDNQEKLKKQTVDKIYDKRIYNVLKKAGLLETAQQFTEIEIIGG